MLNSQVNTCARVSFLIKLQDWGHRFFPVNSTRFFKPSFFTEHLWWLLLTIFGFVMITIVFYSHVQSSAHIGSLFFKENLGNRRSSHRRCSVKKVFLEISQNSQEKTCARVSFLRKLQLFTFEFVIQLKSERSLLIFKPSILQLSSHGILNYLS